MIFICKILKNILLYLFYVYKIKWDKKTNNEIVLKKGMEPTKKNIFFKNKTETSIPNINFF